MIPVDAVVHRVLYAVAPVVFHDVPRARSVRARCLDTSDAGTKACVVSAFDGSSHCLWRIPLGVRRVHRHHPVVFEDLSGYVTWSRSSSLELDPGTWSRCHRLPS